MGAQFLLKKTMKTKLLLILLFSIGTQSCVTTSDVSRSREYINSIGQEVRTKKEYILHPEVEKSYQVPGVTMELSNLWYLSVVRGRFGGSNLSVVKIPQGYPYRIRRVVQRRDPSGHWDYMIGVINIPGTNRSVEFSWHLGEISTPRRLKKDFP